MVKRLKDSFNITLKDNQKGVINFFKEHQIAILTGMAGTAKSTLAIYYAISQLIAGEFEKIILTKPLQPTGNDIGFLRGSLTEKLEPYIQSYKDIFNKIYGETASNNLWNGKKVEFLPLTFIRSTTCENSILIMDEAQNANIHTIMSFVTRMSDNSKTILLGDRYQSDIKRSGLMSFIELSDNIAGHMHLDETYQMRSSLIVELQNRYIEYLNNEHF